MINFHDRSRHSNRKKKAYLVLLLLHAGDASFDDDIGVGVSLDGEIGVDLVDDIIISNVCARLWHNGKDFLKMTLIREVMMDS